MLRSYPSGKSTVELPCSVVAVTAKEDDQQGAMTACAMYISQVTPLILVSMSSLLFLLIACGSPAPSQIITPKPALPRYTPAEVVDLVKTILTKDATNPNAIMMIQIPGAGEAEYKGDGLWFVKLAIGEFNFRESTGTVTAENYDAALLMRNLKMLPR